MGMYDEVIIPKVYCFYCGEPIFDEVWQTKDAECVLHTYNSLEAFFWKNRKVAIGNFTGHCRSCDRYMTIEIHHTETGLFSGDKEL